MTARDIDGYTLLEAETADEWSEATRALDHATELFWNAWQTDGICLGLRAALDGGGYALLTDTYGTLADHRDSANDTHWVLGIYAGEDEHVPVIHELSGLDPTNVLDDEQMAAWVAALLDRMLTS